MAWLFQIGFDSSSQAALDRLSTSLGLLTTAIGKVNTTMTALKDSADALVAEVHAAISGIGELAAEVKDLTDKLAAAVAAGNQNEVTAVTAELTQATGDLKAAVDAALPATPPPTA